MTTSLTIAHVTIQQDENGRYSLNDLYKAAGGANRQRPSLWMANKQTKELIDELISEQEFLLRKKPSGREFPPDPVTVESTGNPATFVVKELVYAYAMWVSPAFHLKVIRAYDALVRGDLAAVNLTVHRMEKAYFEKYTNDSVIRRMAYKGEPYFYIASIIRRTAQSVGRSIKRMIRHGIMDADRLRSHRMGMRSWWINRRKHLNQIPLF
jgi:hypothetical protein